MKKLLALFLALMLCVSMVACGDTAEVTQTDAAQDTQTTAPQIETTAPVETQPQETEPEETPAPETEPVVTEVPATEPKPEGSTPLLYKVTDDFGDVVWLFGSIHAGLDAYYPLPDYVLDAFYGSDALAVEFDIVAFEKDYSAMVEAMTCLIYLDGTTIADHIPEELYDRAVGILKEINAYNSLLDMYCPAVWSSTIDQILVENAGGNVDLGIDKYMINLAYDADMDVLDVESAKLQYGVMAGFSEELQAMILESSVESYENPEEYYDAMQQMLLAWMEGDEAAFGEIVDSSFEADDPESQALMEEYQYAMETERNIYMTQYAVEALENGDEIFICVGSAHIVGEGGMVELLRELGYTVEIVR